MRPPELLRRLRRLATRNGWEMEVQEGANHTKVTLRGRRTIIARHPTDLKTGTFRAILKQLGITELDLEN